MYSEPAQITNPWRSAIGRDMILSPTPPPSQPIVHSQMAHIASLKAIFPDFDDALIVSVLDTAGGDHDRAVDVLLGMSDPSFIPPDSAPPPSAVDPFHPSHTYEERLSQEALDEQFARRLALEEEESASRAWTRWQDAPSYLMYQPYQGRRGSSRSGRSQSQTQNETQQAQGGRDTMTDFQEGFNRIAESGKKTFASIMSKVKAKMQDFEHGQGWSGSQAQSPEYTSSTSYAPQARTSIPSSPPRSGLLRPDAALVEPTQPSYYDPNTRGYDLYDDDATLHTPSPLSTVPPVSVLTPAPHTPHADILEEEEEDVEIVERERPLPPVAPVPETRSSPSPPPSASPAWSPSGVGARGIGAGRGAQVDFSKLGLLPKRPISLVRPQSPPVSGAGAEAAVGAPRITLAHSESTTDSSKDREEPEFVENPFEDR